MSSEEQRVSLYRAERAGEREGGTAKSKGHGESSGDEGKGRRKRGLRAL